MCLFEFVLLLAFALAFEYLLGFELEMEGLLLLQVLGMGLFHAQKL